MYITLFQRSYIWMASITFFFGELQFSDLSERGYDNRYKDTHPLVCACFEDESSTRVQALEHLDLHQLLYNVYISLPCLDSLDTDI